MTTNPTPELAALLACPFCGSPAVVKRNKTVMVSCTGCSASTFQLLRDADSAITAWNTRAAALPQGVLEQDALDAARYRFLRANAVEGRMESRGPRPDFALNCDEPESEWDAAIDAAMPPPPAEASKGDGL